MAILYPQEEEEKAPAQAPVGSVQTVNNTRYKVGSEDTVSYVGADSKKKTARIPGSIEIDGSQYKVTSIDKKAFEKNKKLTKVTIGSNVETIGEGAFNGCKNLKKITIYGDNLKDVGKNSFKGIKKGARITIICKDKKIFNKIVKKTEKGRSQ